MWITRINSKIHFVCVRVCERERGRNEFELSIKGSLRFQGTCNSYTMGCPPVRGDNPRALASGLSYVQVDRHGITILYHLHQCRPCTSRDIS